MSAPSDTIVPELGPLLGRLAHPEPRGPAALPLDDIRLDLLAALYARAGLARREFADRKPDLARHQLSREAWLAVWQDAALRAGDRVLAHVDQEFAMAAVESRVPPKVLARFLPGDEDRRVTRNRVLSAGIPLEQIPPPELAAQWEDGLLRAAMALDASWTRLERVVLEELVAHAGSVERVRRWRRPRGVLWAGVTSTVVLALLLGLSLGGYLPAPGPLRTLQDWFWSLPWP